MHPPYRGISVITPLPFGGGEGGGANWLLVCEVTPTGLLTRVVGKFFSHGGYLVLIRRMSFSLTELTERLRHTENTEAFQLRLAVTFCVIG